MSYLLQPLLRIRTMREDRASGELSAARRELASAEAALEARRRDLAAYEETKEERRDRIYDAIMGRAVSREQIDLANAGVARIDEEGVLALKADNVARAEAERKKREEAAAAARRNLFMATKDRMKIDEHKGIWLAVEAAEEEHRAEGELEDFVVRKLEI